MANDSDPPRRPPWLPAGGSTVLLLLILLLIVAGLVFWGWSKHPPGQSHPAATGVPPTAPAKALPTPH
jgi:hypothetical protein